MKAEIRSSGEFAIAYTVKDEWRFLKHAIPYLLAQGCKQFYVFFDGTSDEALHSLSEFACVQTRGSVLAAEIQDPPDWIQSIASRQADEMDFRKRINTLYAADLARSAGIEWIGSLDADELIIPPLAFESVEVMLSSFEQSVDQVLLPNLEVVPARAPNDNPFLAQTLFLKRQPVSQGFWRAVRAVLSRVLRDPKKIAYCESVFYRLRFGGFPRVLKSPLDGANIYRGLFLGYDNYKAFVRSKRAREFNFNIHRWIPIKRKPCEVRAGNTLHYDIPDAVYFVHKFSQRPPNMLQRNVFYVRYQLGLIATQLSHGAAKEFFENNLCVSDVGEASDLVKRGVAVQVNSVSAFFAKDI